MFYCEVLWNISTIAEVLETVASKIRRCFIDADGEPVRFKDLRAWVYAGDRRPWYVPIYRCLDRYGVRVRHGWWAPNDALMRAIKGE